MQFHRKDPRAVRPAGGVADEESVDMAERRDPPPEPEGDRPQAALIAAGKLSPVQQAQRDRTEHIAACRQCADIDRQRCPAGEVLWQAWTAALEDAYQRLHDGPA